MACYHPIPARRSSSGGPWQINPPLGTADAQLPCNKCLGCRTDRQQDWASRCLHESRNWTHNRFVTLTYDDEHVPPELRIRDLQLFLKRLRKATETKNSEHLILSDRSASIRYVACGEYGETTKRPHYHLCLFNAAFGDEKRWSEKLSTSEILDNLWRNGASKLAPFTSATAAYVAGYITKSGKRKYTNALGQTLQEPFFKASLRPAIGATWIAKHQEDIQNGYLVVNGIKTRIPRYYAKKLLHAKTRAALLYNDLKTGGIRQDTDKFTENRIRDAERIHINATKHKHRDGAL